jgi:hypothetical protein
MKRSSTLSVLRTSPPNPTIQIIYADSVYINAGFARMDVNVHATRTKPTKVGSP